MEFVTRKPCKLMDNISPMDLCDELEKVLHSKSVKELEAGIKYLAKQVARFKMELKIKEEEILKAGKLAIEFMKAMDKI